MAAGIQLADAAAPEGMRIYAIGDVHGRLDCLTRMHEAIAAEIARDRPADWRIVHLGDYVDRGPHSRQVIDFLMNARAREPRVLAVMGNHDEGFLDFLAGPARSELFVRYGGFETASSYGVMLDALNERTLAHSRRLLAQAVPAAHLSFLRALPRSIALGDFFFCHAGVRPGVALDAQDPYDLIWIRNEFLTHPGLFEKVVVHGHTPREEPEAMANRVNVDTAAFHSGRLTALMVEGRRKRFLTARP